ncbi:MAG: DUF4091 domain-containing protein [Eubacteriales bacterium]
MNGYITSKTEWIYFDTPTAPLENTYSIAIAKNGLRGIQMIVDSTEDSIQVELDHSSIQSELFEMIPIPVEYNTISDNAQGGQFVQMDYSLDKPDYCTRKAPFEVFDCLKPALKNTIPTKNGKAVFYFTIRPKEQTQQINTSITIKTSKDTFSLNLQITVYQVTIPEEQLKVTNWFHIENMATYHHIEYGSQAHLDMVRLYAKAMKRIRQTHFFMIIDERAVVTKNKEFNFDYLLPFIRIFREEGIRTMEIGYLAQRGPNMFDEHFKFALDRSLVIDTDEGYVTLNKYLQALSSFLYENNLEKNVIFHISDEPDVHTDDDDILQKRRKTYYMIASLLRKYIPGSKVIEAIATSMFRGGIDILVPLSSNYEKKKEAFDLLIESGDEVWNYVCCSPGGKYLNRFLDFDLIRNRLLFWSCSAYNMSGFLHWGFNMIFNGDDPFKTSSCYNSSGLGTNFPCGDGHIVYPALEAPYLSMRLEAQRQGAEDCELLNLLKVKNYDVYQEILGSTFRKNDDYNADPTDFEETYCKLLQHLE